MQKKTFSKKVKTFTMKLERQPNKIIQFNNEKNEVVSLIAKLEKKTEKQLSGFVKELVKLKKQQVKLEQKLTREKTSEKTSKIKTNKIQTDKIQNHKTLKKKNIRKFKLVE